MKTYSPFDVINNGKCPHCILGTEFYQEHGQKSETIYYRCNLSTCGSTAPSPCMSWQYKLCRFNLQFRDMPQRSASV